MQSRENGMGLVGCILSIPVMLIGLVILGFVFTLINQAYWDYRVEGMCEKDGGRTIYEKVVLSDEEYGAMLDGTGHIRSPTKKDDAGGDKFRFQSNSEVLYRGFFGLSISKYSKRLVRLKDHKVLTEQVRYGRAAGDFPFSASHQSSFVCPKFEGGWWPGEIFSKY